MTSSPLSRIIPVLDLKAGLVVHSIAGRRDEYRPIVSRLTDTAHPIPIATALSIEFGFKRFYIADLDAISERRRYSSEIETLHQSGFDLDIDVGIRSPADLAPLLSMPGVRPVIGLESIGSREQFEAVLADVPRDRVVFSLDLMNQRPIATPDWPTSPLDIASVAVEAGIRNLIVLDLAAVGTGTGCPTLPLCSAIRANWPTLEIITGGGIRSFADVDAACATGADYVLVASALHDGRIQP